MVSVWRKESHLVCREEQAAWSLGSDVLSPASWLFIDGNPSKGNGIFFFDCYVFILHLSSMIHPSPLIYLLVQSSWWNHLLDMFLALAVWQWCHLGLVPKEGPFHPSGMFTVRVVWAERQEERDVLGLPDACFVEAWIPDTVQVYWTAWYWKWMWS